jgi:hypothetical protein
MTGGNNRQPHRGKYSGNDVFGHKDRLCGVRDRRRASTPFFEGAVASPAGALRVRGHVGQKALRLELEGPRANTDSTVTRCPRPRQQELLDIERPELEIECAKAEGKPLRGIWAYADDRTNLSGVSTYPWSDRNISDFIDFL